MLAGNLFISPLHEKKKLIILTIELNIRLLNLS